MMNPEIKAKWLEALRNGKYKQRQGQLCKNEGYCCLGVLAEVCEVPYSGTEHRIYKFNDTERCGFPTEDWIKSLGLNPELAGNLATANDKGSTFEEIADTIEAKA